MNDSKGGPTLWNDAVRVIKGVPRDYSSGEIRRNIFLLAIPMVLEMSMVNAYTLVDTFFVGKLVRQR